MPKNSESEQFSITTFALATLDRPLIKVHTVDLFEAPDWHEANALTR